MDDSRFDTLTRTFAVSRRKAIALAIGGTISALAGLTTQGTSEAARRGFPGPRNPSQPPGCTTDGASCGDTAGRICCNGTCCPPNRCCSDTGQCTVCPDRCEIDGQDFPAGAVDPSGGCGVCEPTQNHFDWTTAPDGISCGGVPGRTCCNGDCCSPTECCDGIGICTECGPHCLIGGVEIDADTVNLANECEACDPARAIESWSPLDDGRACSGGDGCCVQGACGTCSCLIDNDRVLDGEHNNRNDCEFCSYNANPTDWTNRPNGASCGTNRDCCDGQCCPEGQCCTLDGCELCCHIGSDTVADGVVNPRQTCQVCDANRNFSDWTTLRDGEACGATGNSECCNGECCPSGQCCRNGACAPCGCSIGGHSFDPDEINENNPCEICKPAQNRFDWSAVITGTTCNSDGGTCCGRDCCSSELCCLLDACGDCLCSIDNEIFAPEERNGTTCEICDPHANPFEWTKLPNNATCGEHEDQHCCNGFCCDPGQCCLEGACQPCGCIIDGQEIPPETRNLDNDCQICDPNRAVDAWSSIDEGDPCGDTGAQCCRSGVCELCSCLIEDVPVADGEVNQFNECQQCDLALDPSNWSPRNETFACGPAGDGVCCNGVCCPAGSRCDVDDLCVQDGCLIDGVSYPFGTSRPRERCDFCDASNPFDWTPRAIPDCPPPCTIGGVVLRYGTVNQDNPCQICHGGDDWSPSSALDCSTSEAIRVCCHGVCCESGACCGEDGLCGFDACELQGCVIDGVQYEDGATNPSNACQVCNTVQSTTSWTAQFGACGPTGEQFCCAGVCCELGACCNNDDICDFDACETCVIGGQFWFPEDRNPANGCEMCIANANKFAWTPLPDFSWCDEMQITTCCAGVCCPAGEACREGSCQPQ